MPNNVRIPNLAGKTVAQAEVVLTRLGLKLVVDGRSPGAGDANALIDQHDPGTTTGRSDPDSTVLVGGTVGVILISVG